MMVAIIQGPVFTPTSRDEFYTIMSMRYRDAKLEAAAIADRERIKMRIESHKPVHLGLPLPTALAYNLPQGNTQKTLLQNTAFFPWGIMNWGVDDSFGLPTMDFDYMRWWSGGGIDWIGEWFTGPVCFFLERQGAYKGNLDHYVFKGGETFRFYVHSTSSPAPGWLLAFIVLPRTMAESKIYV